MSAASKANEARDPMRTTGIVRRPWHGTFAWSAFALAAIAYLVSLIVYATHTSAVFDEGMHISAGYRYWQCADFGINPEHPPLAKLVAAWPLRHWQLGEFDSPCGAKPTSNMELIGDGYRLINSRYGDQVLRRARFAVLVFPLLLLGVVFYLTRSWFGPLAAGIAVVLLTVEPNLTAHGPLVATDMALTATALLTLAMAWRYLQGPSIPRLILLGLTMGLALSSKHSGAFVPLIALLAVLLDWVLSRDRTSPRAYQGLGGWLIASLIAVVVLWSAYGFRYRALPDATRPGFDNASEIASEFPGASVTGRALGTVVKYHILPESYVAGLLYVKANSSRETYVNGRQLESGVWYYFPLTIMIKTPVTLLLLVLASWMTVGLWRVYSRQLLWLWLPAIVFVLAGVLSKMNLGVRHILPAYPSLVIAGAAAAAYWASRRRICALLLAVLLGWQVASYLHSFPNEIAYANELWGGPHDLYQHLGDSNVDWGQSVYQVRDYLAKHKIEDCWIAWFGARKPDAVGVPCRALPGPAFLEATDSAPPPVVPEQFAGTVLISVPLVDYDLFPYGSFLNLSPKDVIDGGVLVYDGSFDLPQVAAERRIGRGWWFLMNGQAPLAVEEFALAEPHAHNRGVLHSLYAWALMSTGQLEEARKRCLQAADDFAGKPAYANARQAALRQAADLDKILQKSN